MASDPFFSFFSQANEVDKELYQDTDRRAVRKQYARFEKIPLPTAQSIQVSFSESVGRRESVHTYSGKTITLQQISDLLFWSIGRSGKSDGTRQRYAYPSGGAKYPVQAYMYVIKNAEIKGLYYYDPHHKLVKLPYVLTEHVLTASAHVHKPDIQAMLFLTFKKDVSYGRYGKLAYKLGLLEAGAMLQNVSLVAPSIGLGCCVLGRTGKQDGKMEQELHCDSDESVVCRIAIGSL